MELTAGNLSRPRGPGRGQQICEESPVTGLSQNFPPDLRAPASKSLRLGWDFHTCTSAIFFRSAHTPYGTYIHAAQKIPTQTLRSILGGPSDSLVTEIHSRQQPSRHSKPEAPQQRQAGAGSSRQPCSTGDCLQMTEFHEISESCKTRIRQLLRSPYDSGRKSYWNAIEGKQALNIHVLGSTTGVVSSGFLLSV